MDVGQLARFRPAPVSRPRRSAQCGVVAIEFALVLPLLFVVFYASVSYGMVFMLNQSMVFAAEEGARAAVRAESAETVEGLVQERVATSLGWWPDTTRSEVDVAVSPVDSQGWFTVTIELPSSVLPFAPIKLPGLGTVPRIPENLRAQADVVLPPSVGSPNQ